MAHTIRTDRLLLRPPLLRDAQGLWRALDDPEITRMTGTWPLVVTPAYVRFRLRHSAGFDPMQDSLFTIVCQGQPIGLCGLHRKAGISAEVGYMIGREWWGQGLVTEAIRALIGYGFRVMRLSSVQAGVFSDNPASSRVLEKLGFDVAPTSPDVWSLARQSHAPGTNYILTRERFRP